MKVAKFEFSLFGINTYVVYDPATRKAALIDPGMFNAQEEDALVKFVERENLEITNIINTHLHIDHVVGDRFAREAFGAPVLAHQADEFLGDNIKIQAQMFGLPGNVGDVVIDRYLRDGDKINIGDGTLEVIHVPGHSPGGIALYDAADGFLIAGDALFYGSIGRTDLPGGDMDQLLDAIKTRLLTLPGETVVYSGHGPETTIANEKRNNPFLR